MSDRLLVTVALPHGRVLAAVSIRLRPLIQHMGGTITGHEAALGCHNGGGSVSVRSERRRAVRKPVDPTLCTARGRRRGCRRVGSILSRPPIHRVYGCRLTVRPLVAHRCCRGGLAEQVAGWLRKGEGCQAGRFARADDRIREPGDRALGGRGFRDCERSVPAYYDRSAWQGSGEPDSHGAVKTAILQPLMNTKVIDASACMILLLRNVQTRLELPGSHHATSNVGQALGPGVPG